MVCVRFEDGGEAGLLDRRLGQASGRRVPPERERQIETLYRTRYSGFTAKHFHEHLVRDHGFSWGYTWTKVFLQSKGLVPRAKTRGALRRKRPRRPLPGMMLHQDGSRHEWIAGLDAMDLIVTMDDATNTIYSGFWCPRKFIRDVYVPAHNARFAVKPELEGSAFVAITGIDLAEILCVQEERQVGNVNTVVFHTLRLQIPPSPLRAHFVRSTVKVRQYHGGSHAIFHGPRRIGRYDAQGALRTVAMDAAV